MGKAMLWGLLLRACWLASAIALAGCGGNAGPRIELTGATSFDSDLAWPPPDGPLRQMSETQLVLRGRDWTAKGGRAYTEGDILMLLGGQELPWGMYGLSYLSEDNELESLSLQFGWTPLTPGDGTRLYVGLANYQKGCWEWHSAGSSPWALTYQYPWFFRSPEGHGYIACVLAGPGQAQIEQLVINVSGTVVPAPQNLTAESPEVGKVAVNWDGVPLAEGYNVYRARALSWEKAAKLNDEPVTGTFYEDSFMPLGNYYWYWVTAVANNESGPSNSAAVWTHQIELPAPQNPRVSAREETSFTVAWDWMQFNPDDGFRIFVCTYSDFPIGEDAEQWQAFPSARESGIYNRIPGYIYYWKMCARENGLYGRMTDELTGSTKGSWTWGDFEVIDTGEPPIRAVDADGKLAVAYIKGRSVMLATDQGDHWRIDKPLPEGPPEITGSITYSEYLDIAFNGGTFLVAASESCANDAWAAYGRQFDWQRDRIHGDGDFRPVPPHPCSGLYCAAAISDYEMAVVQLDLTGEDREDPDDAQLLVHRRPTGGGTWSTARIRYFSTTDVPSHSISYHAGQLHVLTTDLASDKLYVCNSEGHWTLVDVTPPGQFGLVKHHDLHWFEGEWYTPGFHKANKELYLLAGIDPPWSSSRITQLGEDMGHEARLDVEGDEAVMIFYGYNFGTARYQFAVYSADWAYRPIGVPHVAADDYASGADIVLMDGSPYFVFWDEATEEIKVAKGSPPAD